MVTLSKSSDAHPGTRFTFGIATPVAVPGRLSAAISVFEERAPPNTTRGRAHPFKELLGQVERK